MTSFRGRDDGDKHSNQIMWRVTESTIFLCWHHQWRSLDGLVPLADYLQPRPILFSWARYWLLSEVTDEGSAGSSSVHFCQHVAKFCTTQIMAGESTMSVQYAQPITWRGYVETTNDALVVFQACLSGLLPQCSRRLKHKDRVTSGDVYVYDESSTNMKRWTDHISWSPSRVQTNFLLYRQVQSCILRGQRMVAKKKQEPHLTAEASVDARSGRASNPNQKDRRYIGSLTDSYNFVKDGLLKKTITIAIGGTAYHMVCYYTVDDARDRLTTPRGDPLLQVIIPHVILSRQPKFKWLDFDDPGDASGSALGRFHKVSPPHVLPHMLGHEAISSWTQTIPISDPVAMYDMNRSIPAYQQDESGYLVFAEDKNQQEPDHAVQSPRALAWPVWNGSFAHAQHYCDGPYQA